MSDSSPSRGRQSGRPPPRAGARPRARWPGPRGDVAGASDGRGDGLVEASASTPSRRSRPTPTATQGWFRIAEGAVGRMPEKEAPPARGPAWSTPASSGSHRTASWTVHGGRGLGAGGRGLGAGGRGVPGAPTGLRRAAQRRRTPGTPSSRARSNRRGRSSTPSRSPGTASPKTMKLYDRTADTVSRRDRAHPESDARFRENSTEPSPPHHRAPREPFGPHRRRSLGAGRHLL